MAEFGGGNALSGATAAAVNEAIQRELNNIDDPGLHQIASALLGGVVGKLVGGDAQTGASTAASGTKNNNMLDPAQIKGLLYALQNAESEEEKQQIMAQYIQNSKPSSAANMGLTPEEETQLAEYLQNNYGVEWQSGNIEISLQQAIDAISGKPGTNIPVGNITHPESQEGTGKTQQAMENPGGIVPEQKTIDQMLNEGGSWNSSGQFVESDGTIRQDLPNRGDYEHGKGVPVSGYYEDGTAAIKIDGQWYPAYDAPKRKQNVQEDIVERIKDYAQTSQRESYEFTMDYLAGQQAAAKEKNDRLGDYMPGEKYWPFAEEAEVKEYNGESFGYKLGYYSELSKELGDMIREGMGYNAAYKVPKVSGSNVEGTGKATAPRTINLTSEIDTSGFGKLTFSGVIDAGRSGTTRPLVSTPNSYFKTKAGNIIVYDNEGKLLYDINNERVKIFDINVNPQGKEFLNPRKLKGDIPQDILDLLK